MLTALGKTPEIKLHVKGALNNGLSVEEIKAVLLHATAYCGIPAGLDACKAAHEVLVAEGALGKPPGESRSDGFTLDESKLSGSDALSGRPVQRPKSRELTAPSSASASSTSAPLRRRC